MSLLQSDVIIEPLVLVRLLEDAEGHCEHSQNKRVTDEDSRAVFLSDREYSYKKLPEHLTAAEMPTATTTDGCHAANHVRRI